MFEAIGKFVVGYFVLMVVISSLAVGVAGVGGFFTVLVMLGILVLAKRGSIQRYVAPPKRAEPLPAVMFAPALPAVLPPAVSGPTLARIRGDRWRLEQVAVSLAPRFPADPLDSPAFVDLSHLYLHEPETERDALASEYAQARARFLAWVAAIDAIRIDETSLTSEWADAMLRQIARLDAELAAIRAYLDDVDARAKEAPRAVEQALAATAAATAAVDQASIAQRRLAERHPAPDLAAQVTRAGELLAQANAAIGPERQRPLTAQRLAAEAAALAGQIEQRAWMLFELPDATGRRSAEFASTRARVQREIDNALHELRQMAINHAPSSWLEVRGLDLKAERAIRRAERLWQSAAAKQAAGADLPALEAVNSEIEQAFAALEEAAGHAKVIAAHAIRLEQTARGARRAVEAVEAEVDAGFMAVSRVVTPEAVRQRQTDLLERAASLAAQARDEMGRPQPDWLAVVSLAGRGTEIAALVSEQSPALTDTGAETRRALERGRDLAKAARDRALAISWTATDGDLSSSTRMLLTQAESAYQKARALEASVEERQDREAKQDAFENALDAYRSAETLATTAADQAAQELAAAGKVVPQSQGFAPTVGEAVAWGAVRGVTSGIIRGLGGF